MNRNIMLDVIRHKDMKIEKVLEAVNLLKSENTMLKNEISDVLYDDGDFDINLLSDYIREVVKDAIDGTKLQKNDSVHERVLKMLKVQDVSRKHNDGIDMLDTVESLDERSISCAIVAGDKIQAKFRCQGNEWYDGIVSGVKGLGKKNALYDVQYDDGYSDNNLPADCVRLVEEEVDPPYDHDGKMIMS